MRTSRGGEQAGTAKPVTISSESAFCLIDALAFEVIPSLGKSGIIQYMNVKKNERDNKLGSIAECL